MIVYKATNNDMTCTMGQGTFQYQLGVPATAEKSKCGDTGLHACEYVLDCARYYGLGRDHRYFKAKAEGDIAEDGSNTRIACTRLTLLKELTNRDIAKEAMLYMIHHPRRDNWEASNLMVQVKENTAEIRIPDGIAIARGIHPKVSGCDGARRPRFLMWMESISCRACGTRWRTWQKQRGGSSHEVDRNTQGADDTGRCKKN